MCVSRCPVCGTVSLGHEGQKVVVLFFFSFFFLPFARIGDVAGAGIPVFPSTSRWGPAGRGLSSAQFPLLFFLVPFFRPGEARRGAARTNQTVLPALPASHVVMPHHVRGDKEQTRERSFHHQKLKYTYVCERAGRAVRECNPLFFLLTARWILVLGHLAVDLSPMERVDGREAIAQGGREKSDKIHWGSERCELFAVVIVVVVDIVPR